MMKKPSSNPDNPSEPQAVDGADGELSSPASGMEASPYKSAAEELDGLRKTLREVSQQFARRIDMDIIRLRERIVGAGEEQVRLDGKPRPVSRRGSGAKLLPGDGRLYDLRDMITLLRTLEVKPAVGRRKDLKKIEALVEELRDMIERWG